MDKSIRIVIFIVLGVAAIGGGMWYSNKVSKESEQSDLQAGLAAQQAQSAIMSNFKINDTVVGTGTAAQSGDTVSVLYSGSLDNGTVFDASSLHGNQPYSFVLGTGNVIKGWDLGLLGMKVGGTRTLVIPPELGYGTSGYGSSIPPNATLHFMVQLLSVTSTPAGN